MRDGALGRFLAGCATRGRLGCIGYALLSSTERVGGWSGRRLLCWP